jgi:hypothetical protein
LKAIVGGLALLVAGPVLVIALVAAAIALTVAFVIPLLPLFLLVFVVWLVLRSTSRPTAIAR